MVHGNHHLQCLRSSLLPKRCTPFSSLSAPSSRSQQFTPRHKASHPACPPARLAVPLKINSASAWVFTATTERTCSAATPPLRVKILTTFSANTPTSVTSNHSIIHILNGIINSLLDTRLMADSRKTTTQDSVPLRLPPPALPVVAVQSQDQGKLKATQTCSHRCLGVSGTRSS